MINAAFFRLSYLDKFEEKLVYLSKKPSPTVKKEQ